MADNVVNHIYFMEKAMAEARIAFSMNEVPIGCVITLEGKIIASAANTRATAKNVLHHAEILAINKACEVVGDWRLDNCTIYVTLEPCPMCAGAIVQARMPMLVYGAKSPKSGCAGSIINLLDQENFNHRTEIISGVLEEESAALMREFFARHRSKS